MKALYKRRPIRVIKTTGRRGSTEERSTLIYFGRPWVVLGFHRQRSPLMKVWFWEITRYPKIKEDDE